MTLNKSAKVYTNDLLFYLKKEIFANVKYPLYLLYYYNLVWVISIITVEDTDNQKF